MSRVRGPARWVVAVVLASSPALADDFDRLEGPILAAIPTSPEATSRPGLSTAEMGSLPAPFRETRSAVVVVKTGEGNLARLLLSSAFRKVPGGTQGPAAVLILDRFETFDAGPATSRIARGKGILLFDGFRYDLDTGQVVPEGQGGDLLFSAKGPGGPRLTPEAGASLFTLEKWKMPKAETPAGPSPGRAVRPGDFEGRYQVVANGQWSGTLDLKLAEAPNLTGRFRSDQTGASYKVTGFVPAEDPGLIHFSIELPMARLEFDGRLWTIGKGALAGSTTLLNRTFGFVALREGGRLSPDLDEAASWFEPAPAAPSKKEATLLETGKFRFEGREVDLKDLVDSLSASVLADRATWLLLRVPPSAPFSTLSAAIGSIRASGCADLRLAPAVEAP